MVTAAENKKLKPAIIPASVTKKDWFMNGVIPVPMSLRFSSIKVPALLPRNGWTIQPFDETCAKATEQQSAAIVRVMARNQRGRKGSRRKTRSDQKIKPA